MQTRYYMKDEVPFQDFPAYTERSGGKSKGFVIFLVVILLIAAVVGGLYFLGKDKESSFLTSTAPTTAPTLTPSPTVTPTPELDRTKLKVSVLNGSGVAGAANKTAAALKELGYVTTTGNADNYDYEGVSVKVKEDSNGIADLLKNDLTEKASASAVTTSVDDTISTDAVVIIGK